MNVAKQTLGAVLRAVIGGVVALVVIDIFLIVGVLPPCRVEGTSMAPTLSAGRRIVIDRTAYWFRSPRRWEVVVLRCPHDPLKLCVKRIVGLPGEQLRIRNGRVEIYDSATIAPHNLVYGPRRGQELGDSLEYLLGEQEFFVIGDNSMDSIDSREWEPPGVQESAVLGRVLCR